MRERGRAIAAGDTFSLPRAEAAAALLDNCEHVLDAAPQIAALLAACPHLSVLATSREALRVRSERVFSISPLPLPAETLLDGEALARVPAVALFLERAMVIIQRLSRWTTRWLLPPFAAGSMGYRWP